MRRLEVNGIGLEVEDRGVGPPVVLLYGWPDSHRLWCHQVAALKAAGYRCPRPPVTTGARPLPCRSRAGTRTA